MNVYCISQARLGSKRLPKKVLKCINNKPLLQYQAERINQAKNIDKYIIATTDLEADLPIKQFCQQSDIAYFCGDENNVLSRFYHTAKAFNVKGDDLIIRLTSDCPLVDPKLIDLMINKHRVNKNIAISNINITSYPRGFDAEIFSMHSLTQAYQKANSLFEQEHVTPYFYNNREDFPVQSIEMSCDKKSAELRLCVDESADFLFMEQLILNYPNNILTASAIEIINFLNDNPKIAKINQHVQQKIHL